MRSRWTAFGLAAMLSVAPGAGRAEKVEPAGDIVPEPDPTAEPLPGADLAHPPPGAKEDVALWRAGHEVTKAVHLERARATRLQTVVVKLRYGERVRLLADRGGEQGERGRKLAERLVGAHATLTYALTSRWPVDPYRVCGYPAMEFGSMLAAGKSPPADLAKHRAMLTGCVEQADGSLKPLKAANDSLSATIAECDKALSAAGLGSPTAGLPPKGAAEQASAEKRGGKHDAHEEREEHERAEKHEKGHGEHR